MNISLNKGILSINGKTVTLVIFDDNTAMNFPIKDTNTIIIEDSNSNYTGIEGNDNVVISGNKNINLGNISGTSIRI